MEIASGNEASPVEPAARVDALNLSSLKVLSGKVRLLFYEALLAIGLFAYDAGPSGPTDPFAIPATNQHAILLNTGQWVRCEGSIACPWVMAESVPAGPGSVVIVPAGYPSGWRVLDGICVNANLMLSPALLERVAAETLGLDPARAILHPLLFFEDLPLYRMGVAAANAMRLPNLAERLYVESISNSLAVHLLCVHADFPTVPKPVHGRLSTPVLQQVVEFVAQQPDAELTIANLAALAHLSPYHFARMFKETTGRTVHQYVLAQRLQRSYQLLLVTRLPISQIATDAGFADESHFVRSFHRAFRFTPGAMRHNLP